MNFLRILATVAIAVSLTELTNQKAYARPGEPKIYTSPRDLMLEGLGSKASSQDVANAMPNSSTNYYPQDTISIMPDPVPGKPSGLGKAEECANLADAYYNQGISKLPQHIWDTNYIYAHSAFRSAFYLYEQATQQEHDLGAQARGYLGLARFYRYGIILFQRDLLKEDYCDPTQDYYLAHVYFLKAFHQSYDLRTRDEAAFYLGEMFYLGKGTDKSAYDAKYYFEIAEKGYDTRAKARASLYLGQMYYYGEGYTTQNYDKARQFFEYVSMYQNEDKSAKIRADLYLGVMEYFGLTGPRPLDVRKARHYFEFVVAENDPWAKIRAAAYLGMMHFYGSDCPINPSTARFYFQMAGATGAAGVTMDPIGHAIANVYLGEIYYRGIGVAKDFYRAVDFFKIAANQNDDEWSKNRAKSFLAEMFGVNDDQDRKRDADAFACGACTAKYGAEPIY